MVFQQAEIWPRTGWRVNGAADYQSLMRMIHGSSIETYGGKAADQLAAGELVWRARQEAPVSSVPR